MLVNHTEAESTWLWHDVQVMISKVHLDCILKYLPSPPQAPFGVISTSLQRSLCVLYTSSFSALPSDASISENKSSHCENPQRVNICMIYAASEMMGRAYLLQHLVCTNNVVRVRLQSSQSSRRVPVHVLTQHARCTTYRKLIPLLMFKSIFIHL